MLLSSNGSGSVISSVHNFRYLKSGSPVLKLSATYIQDRTNSNIRRRMKDIIENNYDGALLWNL